MRVGRERLKKILAIIGDMYPEARGELEWETPFQLLIAVILSAQTTDKAVNKVTQIFGNITQKLRTWLRQIWLMLRSVCELSDFIRTKLEILLRQQERFCKILTGKFLRHIKS